jgi:hypothetical protein
MTPIERLRELLDERGVNHGSLHSLTTEDISVTWAGDTCRWVALENPNNRLLAVAVYKDYLTAEQAVDATLGRDQPPYEELIEALRRDWDIEASWDGLRRFWYVGLTEEGVRKREEREATLGHGECRNVADPDEYSDRPFTCSECGARGPMGNGTYHMASSVTLPDGTVGFGDSWPTWRYCPNCGAKVVDK